MHASSAGFLFFLFYHIPAVCVCHYPGKKQHNFHLDSKELHSLSRLCSSLFTG